MIKPGTTEDAVIRNRVNLPTSKSHAEIVRDLDPKIRAQAFFSARVAEAHILDRLREVSDAYSRGECGLGEARNRLKDFLRAEGYDPHQGGLRNLASTARLNLILEQNAAMTHAAAEWKRMHDPDAMKVFPYVRYHASVGSRAPRPDHQQYDGMIFDKNDPWLRTHTPPWDFGCHCELEEITAREAGKTPDLIRPPTPAEKVTIDSKSGFSFDPAHVFEEFDMSAIKEPEQRRATYRQMESYAFLTGEETALSASPEKPVPVCAAPENMDEIQAALEAVKKAVDAHKAGEPYIFPDLQVSFGHIARERFDAIGMQPDDDVEVIFESPGKSDYGMKHWKKHHLDDWKSPEAVKNFIIMMSETIWNPEAKMANTLSKSGKRIDITSPDGRYVASLRRRGHVWVYSIQDVWDQSDSLRTAPPDVRSQRQRGK